MKHAPTLRSRLPLLPPNAQVLSPDLALAREDGNVVFFNGSGPIYSCREDDHFALRVAGGMLVGLGLASPTAVAAGLEVHPSTICRNRDKLQSKGAASLKPQRPGPQGAHKLRGRVRAKAQRLLDEGLSMRKTAERVGVAEGTIRHALKTGQLMRGAANESGTPVGSAVQGETLSAQDEGEGLSRSGERSREDSSCEGGVGVKRVGERVLARMGKLVEAEPEFTAAEGVSNAGVLIALAALLDEGLLKVGEQVYGALRNGFFGLRATLLTLAFMAMLRIKTPEQLTSHAPGELGFLLGLDRAPEVKTLRRKLAEMGGRGLAHVLRGEFTRYWVETKPEAVGFLYVDGHVRAYNGRKHTLPKEHVPRRRLCMPATTDYWVNDEQANPVFFVTAPAHDGLGTMLNRELLPEVRQRVGEGRRVTVIFDREGWSPKSFARWFKQDFDVITYRKGPYDDWPEKEFVEIEVKVEGRVADRTVSYRMAERRVEVTPKPKFSMREVRKLCDDGHQVSIMTTREDLPVVEIADRLSSRWRQVNFFRYMRHEFAHDHLGTNAVEPADPERTVPNPKRREKDKEIKGLRAELNKLEREYGQRALDNPESRRSTMRGFKIAHAQLGQKIRRLQHRWQAAKQALNALPERVPVRTVHEESKIVQLESERKVLTDTIKMLAYRAETSLCALLRPFFARHEEEARDFLKTVFRLPADLVPLRQQRRLLVRLHSMSNPRSNRALAALCEIMNERQVRYPGTELCLVFEPV